MKLKGLILKTDAFHFDDNIHRIGRKDYQIDYDIDINFNEKTFQLITDVQYFTIDNQTNPMISLRVESHAIFDPIKDGTKEFSETILFSLKMQFRYMSFIMWQKLDNRNVKAFEISVPNDRDIFEKLLTRKANLARLNFDSNGCYEYPL